MSHYFTARELRGLNKTGAVLCPGGDGLPSFAETGYIEQIDRMARFMGERDRDDLKRLAKVLSVLPKPAIHGVVQLAMHHERLPDWLAPPLRMLEIGLKGLFLSPYYSFLDDKHGETLRQRLRWDAKTTTTILERDEMNRMVELANPLLQDNPHDAPDWVRNTYAKARSAQVQIAAMPLAQRLTFITRLRRIILQRSEEILDVVVADTLKSRYDALLGEIFGVLENLEYLEKHARAALADEKVPTPLAMMGKTSKIVYEPLGAVLVISPWNYPFYQAIAPITMAFVAGNAVIYKPSELTPLTGLVEKLLAEAGFAPDWAQIVYGDGKVGAELLAGKPNKVMFTGSVATGKRIAARAAAALIPVELELGGKDPMLVFDDVTMERAVQGALWGAMTNSGQNCTSVERLYVQAGVYDEFKRRLVAEANKIKLGSDQDSDMGGMTSLRQVEIVRELVDDAKAHGAVQLTGLSWDGQSRFIPPIIIEGSDHGMRINQEELFGPVVTLMKFHSEEEAIMLANDSAFGLNASVWSKDKARAERVARQLQCGGVTVNNVMVAEGNHALPFGGSKDSGIGRYKGVHGLRTFCNIKALMLDADSKKIEANWYPFTPEKYKLGQGMVSGLFSDGLSGLLKFAVNGLKLESLSAKAAKNGR